MQTFAVESEARSEPVLISVVGVPLSAPAELVAEDAARYAMEVNFFAPFAADTSIAAHAGTAILRVSRSLCWCAYIPVFVGSFF